MWMYNSYTRGRGCRGHRGYSRPAPPLKATTGDTLVGSDVPRGRDPYGLGRSPLQVAAPRAASQSPGHAQRPDSPGPTRRDQRGSFPVPQSQGRERALTPDVTRYGLSSWGGCPVSWQRNSSSRLWRPFPFQLSRWTAVLRACNGTLWMLFPSPHLASLWPRSSSGRRSRPHRRTSG